MTPEEFWLINRVDREAPLGVNTVARYRYERWRSTRNLVARAIRAGNRPRVRVVIGWDSETETYGWCDIVTGEFLLSGWTKMADMPDLPPQPGE